MWGSDVRTVRMFVLKLEISIEFTEFTEFTDASMPSQTILA